MLAYATLFLRWNAKINLSAARSIELLDQHIADCVFVAGQMPTSGTLLDVGAGGGLPSVVIAICRPTLSVVALEPVHKKTAFLRTAARELGLGNFEAHAERMNDHARRDYDAAIARWLGARELAAPCGEILIVPNAAYLIVRPR